MKAAKRYLTREEAEASGLAWAEDWKAKGYEVARMPEPSPTLPRPMVLPPGAVLDIEGLGRCRVVRMLNLFQVLLQPIRSRKGRRSARRRLH